MNDRLGDFLCRLDSRVRDLPPNAACADCQIAVPMVLQYRAGEVLCHECALERRGLSRYEEHHVGGRPSELLITVPANLHRLLSVWQELTWREVFMSGSGGAVLVDLLGLCLIAPSFPDAIGASEWATGND
jgi:hypothetical protein